MRPFRSAATGAGRRSTGFQQNLLQVAIGPSEGGVFHGPESGAGPSWARPPPSASGRAAPATSARLSTTESVDSVVGLEGEGEAHLEGYGTGHNQLSSYVDMNNVIHTGPSTGKVGSEGPEVELSERAQDDALN